MSAQEYVPPPYVPTGEFFAEDVSPPRTYATGATARWITCKCGDSQLVFDHTLQEADRHKIRVHCWAPTAQGGTPCARTLYEGGRSHQERVTQEDAAAAVRRDRQIDRLLYGAGAGLAIVAVWLLVRVVQGIS